MIFKIAVGLLAILALVYVNRNVTKPSRLDGALNVNWPQSLGVIVLAIILFPLMDSFGIVPAGDTGVVTQFGGVVMGDIKHEGLYMVPPASNRFTSWTPSRTKSSLTRPKP